MRGNENSPPSWKFTAAVFLSSQTISLFGSSLVQFALIWYIARTTNSGVMVTISTVTGILPQLFISLFAGVWADRYDRKRIIILSDGLIAAATLALALVFLSGRGSLPAIFAVSAVRSLGMGIQYPAVGALLSEIVPSDKLLRVNGINGTIQSIVLLASPAVGGAVLSWFGLEAVLFIDVITAALAILFLLLLAVPKRRAPAEAPAGNHLNDLKEGIAYSLSHPFVRNLLVYNGVLMFLVVPAAFLNVLMVTRVFGNEYWRLTANEMAFFAGSILGGVVISAWGGFKNRVVTLAASTCVFGALTVTIGLVGSFPLYLAVIGVTGMTMPFFTTPTMTLVQEKVEAGKQGRVFGLLQLVSSGVMPLGMAVFGPLADVVRIEGLMIFSGILLVLQGVTVFRNKVFINEGLPPGTPRGQASSC
jgi:DHA3 family macrolide efflux protein-like MFS transporter